MRVAALADVHGNAVALEAVLAELEREQPDLIVSCGDLTWGPLPLETVTLLEPWRERILCVRGNSERELVERKLIDSEIAVWEHEQHDGARAERVPRAHAAERDRRGRRAGSDALLPRLAAERRGVRDRRDTGRRASPSSRRAWRLRASSPRTRTCSTTGAWGRRGCSTRAASACRTSPSRATPTGRSSARTSSCAGRRTTSTPPSSGCAPAACPRFERIEELMRTPPPHAEVIEHAERVVFSG